MRTAHVALLFGAILGFVLVVDGFGSMLIVALVGAIAWSVGRVLEGDVDVAELLERTSTSRRSPGTRGRS
jgi:hypothetical protein